MVVQNSKDQFYCLEKHKSHPFGCCETVAWKGVVGCVHSGVATIPVAEKPGEWKQAKKRFEMHWVKSSFVHQGCLLLNRTFIHCTITVTECVSGSQVCKAMLSTVQCCCCQLSGIKCCSTGYRFIILLMITISTSTLHQYVLWWSFGGILTRTTKSGWNVFEQIQSKL